MRYLNLRRSRLIIASFVIVSVLLAAFPAIDLYVSRLFFHGRFNRGGWQEMMHMGVGYFLGLSLISVLALYAWNRLTKRKVCGVDGRRVVYLFLVLIVGAGLIVNVTFKDNFGRARPRDVAEFGGLKQFTPAFVVSRECSTNCSFSSGDGAAGFFSLALALALSRRRAIFLAGLAFGAVVSLARISSGAHFFSDTVVSFFVMLTVADVLYYYVVLNAAEKDERGYLEGVPRPAYIRAGS
jgi:lipid A 4'-phosphatase